MAGSMDRSTRTPSNPQFLSRKVRREASSRTRCPLSPCYSVGFGRLIRRVAEPPDFASPVWEELEIRENLPLIYDAERLAGSGQI